MASLKYWLWLTTRRGLGAKSAQRVLERFGTPEGAFFADPSEYERIPDLSPQGRASLEQKGLEEADKILGDCDRLGIQIMTLQDADYPERLKHIYDPPLVLYRKGRAIPFDEEVTIGMVGTRSCTPYGEKMAGRLALGLARSGAVTVSGIAQGIDAACIRGALKGGGTVVSVLGCGIDVRYPACNRGLYEDVAAVGALLSEYPPGTEPIGSHFPIRNRIISGLSLGIVVVESPLKGGAMLTADHALEQDREVFAVPGPADSPASAGCNQLIGEGAAKLTETVWDILEEYVDRYPQKLSRTRGLTPEQEAQRLEEPAGTTAAVPEKSRVPVPKEVDKAPEMEYIDWKDQRDKLTDDQRDLLLALEEKPMLADDLMERTQIPARRVLSALTLLQVQGYVTEEPGKRFRAQVRLKME